MLLKQGPHWLVKQNPCSEHIQPLSNKYGFQRLLPYVFQVAIQPEWQLHSCNCKTKMLQEPKT